MSQNDKELEAVRRRDEISWLQEAALTMRAKLDKQPDNLGPKSDKVALRILAILESLPHTKEDLVTRYKLAKSQLAILPPAEEDDAEEWINLRHQCEEVIQFIERIDKLTAEVERLSAKCSKMKGSGVGAPDES